ncbi:MAG: response regulator [Verrucomicrobiota bacterium]
MAKHTVLSVEDNSDDILLLQRACEKSAVTFHLKTVEDGQRAIDYLSGINNYSDREEFPVPSLVLLDLQIPAKSGLEVLDWIRQKEWSRNLPVVVFTSSQDKRDVQKAYDKGANWFVTKPADYQKLQKVAQSINAYMSGSDAASFSQLETFLERSK